MYSFPFSMNIEDPFPIAFVPFSNVYKVRRACFFKYHCGAALQIYSLSRTLFLGFDCLLRFFVSSYLFAFCRCTGRCNFTIPGRIAGLSPLLRPSTFEREEAHLFPSLAENPT
jgi:hypothetical protein